MYYWLCLVGVGTSHCWFVGFSGGSDSASSCSTRFSISIPNARHPILVLVCLRDLLVFNFILSPCAGV